MNSSVTAIAADLPSLTTTYRQLRPRLIREVNARIHGRLRRRIDASDVVQEAFLEADRRLAEDPALDVPIESWLRVLLKQKLIDFQRRHVLAARRSVRREVSMSGDCASAAPLSNLAAQRDDSPSTRLRQSETAVRVREIIGRLSELDAEVLRLRHFRGLNNADVAKLLGISINAASNRYIRALRHFRERVDTLPVHG